jgi:PAS domain S-box-containing protein
MSAAKKKTGRSGAGLKAPSKDLLYRALIEANELSWVVLNHGGAVIDASPSYVTLTGHTDLKQILRHKVISWTAESEKEQFAQMLRTCLKEGRVRNFSTKYRHPEGPAIPCLMDATVEQIDGSPAILALVREDLTTGKQLEHWLREPLSSKPTQGSVPFLFSQFDDQLRLIRWNHRLEEVTGYSAAELKRKTLLSWFPKEELTHVHEGIRKLRETGYCAIEAHLVTKGGAQILYHFVGITMNSEGNEGFAGIAIDLTDHELAERALGESAARLRTVVDKAPLPIAIGRGTTLLYANATYLRLMRATSTDQIIGFPILHQFAPECRDEVAKFLRHREQGLPAPAEYDTTGLRRDGTTFPAHVAISRIELTDGPVSLAFVTDSTERIRADAELKTTNEQLRLERSAYQQMSAKLETTLNALPDLLFELDSQYRIVDFRAPHPELLYVPDSQFLGKKVSEVLPKEAASVVTAAAREAEKTGLHRGATYPLPMPTGLRWFELSISRVPDPGSAGFTYIALARDITDRKETENRLAQLNEQLRLERETLQQKNIALRELVVQISENRQNIGTQIQSNIEMIVLPILDRLAVRLDDKSRYFLSLAEAGLSDVVAPFVGSLRFLGQKLTQREIELCHLIKRGHSSKDIAELRGCSFQTVLKQRAIIRRKLGVAGKDISLVSYLNSIGPALNHDPAVD